MGRQIHSQRERRGKGGLIFFLSNIFLGCCSWFFPFLFGVLKIRFAEMFRGEVFRVEVFRKRCAEGGVQGGAIRGGGVQERDFQGVTTTHVMLFTCCHGRRHCYPQVFCHLHPFF